LSQSELDTLRIYIAQISAMNISIAENIAEEMQNEFVRSRKEIGGEGIDETWFGRRIVVAKGLTRINGCESVAMQEWKDSLDICTQWDSRRK
jgi:hypothetical protein